MGLIFPNFLWELAAVVVTVAFLLYRKIKKKLRYFKERGIPYFTASIMDNINTIREDLTLIMFKAYNAGGDVPIVGFFEGFFDPNILIKDPDLVRSVLIKDFSHFHDHSIDIDVKTNPLDGHLFNMKGDEWRTLRHRLAPTFTSGKLKTMVPTMVECAERLIKELKQDPMLCQDVKMKDLFKQYSLGVLASCAFGIDPESIQDPNCEFKQLLNKVLNPKSIQSTKVMLVMLYPALCNLLKIKTLPQDVEEFFLSLTKQSFELRKNTGMKRNDFVQLLLELKEKGSVEVDVRELEEDEKEHLKGIQTESSFAAKLELTDELLSAQMFVFIVAGFENSSFIVAITTYVLSTSKELQERVRKEVRDMKEKHGSIDYTTLKDMKLLQACVDEALRIYPPVAILMRECTKTYTLSNGMTIEKGMSIVIPSKFLQNDSKYWDKPEEINPDRFLEGNFIPGTYLPFGDGPRLCIAQRFALLQAKLMVAKLVENFEILPNKKNKEPLNVQTFISVEIEGGLWGNFKPLAK